jgi:hypothetical protein
MAKFRPLTPGPLGTINSDSDFPGTVTHERNRCNRQLWEEVCDCIQHPMLPELYDNFHVQIIIQLILSGFGPLREDGNGKTFGSL